MRQISKKIKSGRLDVKEDDPFELFVAATNIRYCYYAETHKILGNTYGMCVLQVGLKRFYKVCIIIPSQFSYFMHEKEKHFFPL